MRELGRIRSALFTPGTEAARLRKAVHSGADLCIFDLEDSVPLDRLEEARQVVAAGVRELKGTARIWVRVHAASRPEMGRDLSAIPLDEVEGVVLPKVDHEDDIDACHAAIAHAGGPKVVPVLPIIESAQGVLNCRDIAGARGVAALALGRFDLAADLGIDPDFRTPPLSAARALVVLASASARLANAPLDSPWLKIQDLDGLRRFAQQARQDGFAGMLLIHPSHVEPVNQVFSPTVEEIDWARGVLADAEAAAAGGRGAFARQGEMVDEAILRRARAILNNTPG
jgi:(S)-citramalyl-CoA lyase